MKVRQLYYWSIALLLLFSSQSYSQDILWEKSFGGRYADYLMDVQATPDNGFLLAGSSMSEKSGNKTADSAGDLDYWILKMDEDGDLEWQNKFGGSGTDMLQHICLTKDGGFILAGNSDSIIGFDKKDTTNGQEDYWVIKLDAGGGIQWQKTIGGSGQDVLKTICQTSDGGYLLGGSSSSEISGNKTTEAFGNLDFWLVKIDEKGTIEWQKSFGGIYADELKSLEQTKDRGYIIGGYSNSPKSGNKTDDNIGIGDYWVLKLDTKGDVEWQKTIGGNKDDELQLVHQTYDNGFIVGGNSNSSNTFYKNTSSNNGTDIWILKLDIEGTIKWQESYNIGEIDVVTSVIENDDHSLLLGGFAKSETCVANKSDQNEINDYVVIKLNENGVELWRKSVGSSGEDVLRKVIETRDGGYLLAGISNPTKKNNAVFTNKKKSGFASNSLSIGNGNQLSYIKDKAEDINAEIAEINSEINEYVKENVAKVADKAKKLTDKLNENSKFKTSLNAPTGNLLNNNSPLGSGKGNNLLGGLGGTKNSKLPNSNPSRDKEKNYGTADFWVVKLKDKMKPFKEKYKIEAYPNPATNYTTVLLGFDFDVATARLIDLGGRQIQEQKVTNKSFLLSLSNLPTGIYIINVVTNKENQSLKIIKN
jgi:hypothetical protein